MSLRSRVFVKVYYKSILAAAALLFNSSKVPKNFFSFFVSLDIQDYLSRIRMYKHETLQFIKTLNNKILQIRN